MYPAYYVICVNGYEINGTVFKTGQIDWKPKECRPIQNNNWRKATEVEINKWLNRTHGYDMRVPLAKITACESGLNIPVVSITEGKFCPDCGKRKKMKGDGTIELLCEY